MKDIPGYEGLYAVDEDGNVYSLQNTIGRRKGVLKPYENTGGYLRVNLFKDGKCKHEYVHRLVASAYIPNPKGLKYVNHLNSNRQDNRAANLEWCTAKYNIAYSRIQGNQKRDTPVKATFLESGEVRIYPLMKLAGLDLFGKKHALEYHKHKYGNRFIKGGWLFEICERI